jgi:hypothetical protein
MTVQAEFHQPPRRGLGGVAPGRRVVAQFFVAVLVVVSMVALTAMASSSNRPPTEVRGDVELINDIPRVSVATTAPEVEIIDAVCITNTPTYAPC